MSSFDTTSNTVSTTFTNAYGTISLLPSDSAQRASGFGRTTGWRYFEVYIDAQGGDNARLFAGVQAPPFTAGSPGWMIGGDNKNTGMTGNVFNPAYPYSAGTVSITACVGDTLMFAVDMTGDGRLHDGTTAVGTLTDGAGNILTRLVVEVGKNGTWAGTGLITFAWPSHGYPMRVVPWVARDSTSASNAMVSLRVQTTSFVYTIPTGMVAWGDGPEGGTSVSSSVDWLGGWDPATIGSDQTLTFSNPNSTGYFYGHDLLSNATFSAVSVKTPTLPTSGKRVVEFWGGTGGGDSHFGNNSFGGGTSLSASGHTAIHGAFGLVDSTLTQISFSAGGYRSIAAAAILCDLDGKVWRRGVNSTASITQTQAAFGTTPYQQNGFIWYVDFDTQRVWWRQGQNAANSFLTGQNWTGRTLSNSDGPSPYNGMDGMTFSYSTGAGLKVAYFERKDFGGGVGDSCYINIGQLPFRTFPLLPGWKSLDGSRQCQTTPSSVWDTSIMPTSISTCFSGLGVRRIARGSADHPAVRNTLKKYSGKWYFEIFREPQAAGGLSTDSECFGLVFDTATTLTFNNTDASIGATGLWADLPHRLRLKPGSRTSISVSMTVTSGVGNSGTNRWMGCAVDFDTGRVWFGQWNWARGAMAWAVGADPVAGTQPDMTFTASTTLYAATQMDQTSNLGWTYFIAETANCIGTPSGFTPWNGTSSSESLTATPSGTSSGSGSGTGSGGARVLWPYGFQT